MGNKILGSRIEKIQNELNQLKAELKKEPEFKVGMWVVGEGEYYPHSPALIIKENGNDHYEMNDFNGYHEEEVLFLSDYGRPATRDEIEAHLKRICDEKYIGKTVKCLRTSKKRSSLANDHWVKYYFDTDEYWMAVGNTVVLVYNQGQFAEIIPDKKPLPKTKEEFTKFLDDFWNQIPEDTEVDGLSINNFLDQYAD